MASPRLSASLVVLLLAFSFIPASQAATLGVGGGGYGSVQAALSAAMPGDVILVEPGIYAESLSIDTPGITLKGDGPGVEIRGSGAYTIEVVADDVRLERLTIGGGTDAVLAHGVSGLHLDTLHIDESTGNGLDLRNVAGATIREVSVSGVPATAARLLAVSDADVNGLATEGGNRGIHIVDSAGSFEHVAAHSPVEHGIVIERSAATLDGVHVMDAEFGLWILDSPGVHAQDILIGGRPTSWFGVLVQASSDVRLQDVQAADLGTESLNIGNGIEFRDSPGAEVRDATVVAAGSNAFRFAGGDVALRDWQATDSKRALHIYNGPGSIVHDGLLGTFSEHGLVIEQSADVDVRDVRLDEATLGLWLLGASNAQIHDVEIQEARDTAVITEGSTNIDVQVHVQRAPTGVFLHGAHDSILRDSHVQHIAGNGVVILASSNATLQDNTINDVGRGIHVIDSGGILIDDNDVGRTDNDGIVVEGSHNATVSNNDVEDGNIGIWFRGSDQQGGNNTIRANIVRDAIVSGISLDNGASGVEVADNDVQDNRRGIKINKGSTDNVLRNNTVIANDHGIWVDLNGGDNLVVGGIIGHSNGCDIVAIGPDTGLVLDGGVDLRGKADAHNRSHVEIIDAEGRLKVCHTDFDRHTGQIIARPPPEEEYPEEPEGPDEDDEVEDNPDDGDSEDDSDDETGDDADDDSDDEGDEDSDGEDESDDGADEEGDEDSDNGDEWDDDSDGGDDTDESEEDSDDGNESDEGDADSDDGDDSDGTDDDADGGDSDEDSDDGPEGDPMGDGDADEEGHDADDDSDDGSDEPHDDADDPSDDGSDEGGGTDGSDDDSDDPADGSGDSDDGPSGSDEGADGSNNGKGNGQQPSPGRSGDASGNADASDGSTSADAVGSDAPGAA